METDDKGKLEDSRLYLLDVARCSIAWLPLHRRFDLVLGKMKRDTTPDRAIEKALEYAEEFKFDEFPPA